MTTEQLIAIIAMLSTIATAAAAACGAALSVLHRRADAGPAPPMQTTPAETPPAQPSTHVHTYAFRSAEKIGAATINTYKCTDCDDVQRWVAAS